jgi:hypothetical protein
VAERSELKIIGEGLKAISRWSKKMIAISKKRFVALALGAAVVAAGGLSSASAQARSYGHSYYRSFPGGAYGYQPSFRGERLLPGWQGERGPYDRQLSDRQ